MATLGERLQEFLALDDSVEIAEDALKDLKAERAKAEELLRDEFERAGISNTKCTDGRVVYLHRQLWARAKDGDKLAVTRALMEIGAGDLVTQTFNTNRLSSYVREADNNDEELPAVLAEAIEVSEVFSLRIRAS